MHKIIGFLACAGWLGALAFGRSQRPSKTQDDQELRRIEAETANFEEQSDASKMRALADDWVCLTNVNRKTLSKDEFQKNVKNGSNSYTIEKKERAGGFVWRHCRCDLH